MKKIIILVLIVGGLVVVGKYFYTKDIVPANEVTSTPTSTPVTEKTSPMSFFITSSNPGTGGDLGGLRGADAYCSLLAEKAGVTNKVWKAYLSTTGIEGENARDRIGSGPWYNAKGELVAATLEELHGTNSLAKSTALDENGLQINGRGDTPNWHDMLTGSMADGSASTSDTVDTTCGNWTSSSTGSAIVGHHDRIGINDSAPMKSWNSSHGTRGCSIESFNQTGGAGLFYCFAQ